MKDIKLIIFHCGVIALTARKKSKKFDYYFFKVSAALRPAFSPDTPSDVTAAACNVSMHHIL